PTSAPTYRFAIPASPLPVAIARIGGISGARIAYAFPLPANATSQPVSGTLTTAAALRQALAGTGIGIAAGPDGALLLTPSTHSTITLGPVRVGGQSTRQNPTGPGIGYVAETTMAGTKTDTPLTEIPNSIYVITKQQMVDQQPQNVQEALRYTPGIYAESWGTYSQGSAQTNTILQRGFGTSQFVDGLMSESFSAGETAFLERIEAINGPASVMYGQTTPGGMIAMSLKKPTDTPLHQASLGFGSWSRYEATVDVSDKVTRSGNVRYRIAAIGTTQGTQTRYVDYHRVGVLPSITWDIDHDTSLSLIGSYLYTPGSGANTSQQPPYATLLPGAYGRLPRSRFLGDRNWNENANRDAMFEYQFHHRFNRFIAFDQVFRFEQSQWNYERMNYAGMLNQTTALRLPSSTKETNDTVGLDSRVHGNFDIGQLSNIWVVGSDFRQYSNHFHQIFDRSSGFNGLPGFNGFSTINIYDPQSNYIPCVDVHNPTCRDQVYNGNTSYFQEGVYFQDQIKWKGLSILLGGRQDWVNYHGGTTTTSNINATSTATTSYSADLPRPQSAFTWRAGLVYAFDFGLSPYFSYSTSFIPQTGNNWQGNAFPPLTGRQYEAGLKYKVPHRDILITGAAYHIDENHYLITDPVHTDFSADAGRVTSEGFELAANANITRDLRAIASYSFTKATFTRTNLIATESFPDGSSGADVAEKGKYVPTVPRNMFSFFLDYTPPYRPLRGFGLNGGLRYIGSTYNSAANSYKVPAYLLFDIGAHYDLGAATPILRGLKAQLAVSNLTNKYYITSCTGAYSCYIGQGRRLYGNLTYSW
ncbi:MAG: TonB-dependent siderophore receptor, partial [Gluconacetobacter liquefaciens]